jgi:hypothetical protein
MIVPVVKENGLIYYGEKFGWNIKAVYGIEPTDYLKIHETLIGEGLQVLYPDTITQVLFALYCTELLRMGFALSNLISEFNSAQKNNYTEVSHALSLAKLCYYYQKAGFDIIVNKTDKRQSTPDLIINRISCDLKVRHDQTFRRTLPYVNLLKDRKWKEFDDKYSTEIRSLQRDLLSALENRSSNQAECLIFDLSNLPHTWNYFRMETSLEKKTITGISNTPLRAESGHCIIFSSDDNVTGFRGRKKFQHRAFWGYVLYDPTKREIISTRNEHDTS